MIMYVKILTTLALVALVNADPMPTASDPKITGVSPDKGQTGTTVTISGEGLNAIVAVLLVGVEAQIVAASDTEVIVIAGQQDSGMVGDVVIVSDSDSEVSFVMGFTYVADGPSPAPSPAPSPGPTPGSDGFDCMTTCKSPAAMECATFDGVRLCCHGCGWGKCSCCVPM